MNTAAYLQPPYSEVMSPYIAGDTQINPSASSAFHHPQQPLVGPHTLHVTAR
jgi:hypothetical protein